MQTLDRKRELRVVPEGKRPLQSRIVATCSGILKRGPLRILAIGLCKCYGYRCEVWSASIDKLSGGVLTLRTLPVGLSGSIQPLEVWRRVELSEMYITCA